MVLTHEMDRKYNNSFPFLKEVLLHGYLQQVREIVAKY